MIVKTGCGTDGALHSTTPHPPRVQVVRAGRDLDPGRLPGLRARHLPAAREPPQRQGALLVHRLRRHRQLRGTVTQ